MVVPREGNGELAVQRVGHGLGPCLERGTASSPFRVQDVRYGSILGNGARRESDLTCNHSK